MRTNVILFWVLAVFFAIVSAVYVVWALVDTGQVEWAGATALALGGAFAAMIAVYLGMARKAQGGELPEDIPTSDIDDGDPEVGFFSPWSWWPIIAAAATSLAFLGIAIGYWITWIGLPILAIAVAGWIFEYYRGYFSGR